MKIIHVIESLDPKRGGPPTVAARLAAAQGRAGHDVSIVSYDVGAAREALEKQISRIPGIGDVRMHFVSRESSALGSYFRAREAHRQLKEIIPSADVLHLHGLWEPILFSASKVARRIGIPYVVRPCGMLDPWSLSQKRVKKQVGMILGYRSMLNRAAFMHTLNVDEKRLILNLQLACPMQVIPNGIFVEEVDPLPAPGTFQASRPQLNGRPYILFLSRLHYKKGLDFLADAYQQFANRNPDVDLVVAGPDEGARTDFQQRIAAAGLQSRVHLVGPLYGVDKFAAMVDATCFCLPSRQEGFSLAITEALAAGLPVVISEACHFPEVAEAGAGIVAPLDSVSIADALTKVYEDEPRRKEMARKGRQLVLDNYTWPVIADQVISAYYQHIPRLSRIRVVESATSPLRILHVVRSLDPAGGGPPVVVTRLAAAQAALDHDVHIVSYSDQTDHRDIQAVMNGVPNADKIRTHLLMQGNRMERIFAGGAGVWLEQLIGEFNIVHLHGVWDSILRRVGILSRRMGIPYVVAPHGMLDPWSLSQKRFKKRLALTFGYRSLLNNAAFLHTLNDDERKLIGQMGLTCPMEVIPNGIFPSEVDPLPAPGSFRNLQRWIGKKPYILFLSRLHQKKGLDYLAEAFAIVAKKIPDLQLLVAGPDGGEREVFTSHIQRLGLKERTHLLGPLYGAEKLAAYVDAAVFCLPSRQEGFSMAITEALASGTPAVISDACHFPEVATAGAGIITPLDPPQIAAALEAVLTDPAKREAMGANGRNLILSNFTWPRIAERTAELYRRAITVGV